MVDELVLRSPAFQTGEAIPDRYGVGGANISPPLEWEGLPEGTESLALICEDPDASSGIWSHWMLYNLPTGQTGLKEDLPTRSMLDSGVKQGRNDFGAIGYGGPSPPAGSTHRYFFRLYALDQPLTDADPGMTRRQLLDRIEGHVLASAELMGTYHR